MTVLLDSKRAGPPQTLSLPTRASLAILWPMKVALRPLGYFFKIREPLGVAWRVALPLVLVAGIVALWYFATKGESYLARHAKLSELEEKEADLERRVGAPLDLETVDKERKLFTGEKKVWAEIAAVSLARTDYEARKDAIEKIFGKENYTVEAPEGAAKARLVAKMNFGKTDRLSEFGKARERLEAAIPGIKLETRERVDSPGTPNEKRVVITERAILPRGTALDDPKTRKALDDVFGAGAYVPSEAPEGIVLVGTERVEERLMSPAMLPSPLEMVDSLPSLLNQKWSTWDDARAWWKLGKPEQGPTPAPPLVIDWSKWNEIPFRLAEAAYARLIGPEWRDWKLLYAVTWSTIRIVMGFLWGSVLAVPLGVIMGSFAKPRAFFEPVRLIGSYLPLPAFLSLTIFYWGMGEDQKIGFLAVCTFVVLLPQVIMAVEAIPQAHIDSARTLGATRWQLVRYVLLAGAKAEIMRSLRLSFAVGWTWIIVAEMINPLTGIGYLIQVGERRGGEYRAHVYAMIALVILLAFVVNTVWARIERRLYPYREEH